MHIQEMVDDIDRLLPDSPPVRPGGSLLIMVGLPGVGKSFVVDALRNLIPLTVVRTDRVRSYVRGRPTYTAAEMTFIYEVCFALVDKRLGDGQRVVFDASNYLAARRQRLATIARRREAPVAVCHVQASEAVTRRRLSQRLGGGRRENDYSDAGWSVYQWMVEAQEPVALPHLRLDTTATPPEELAQRLRDYWFMREETFASDDHLQSAGWPGGYGYDD